MGCEWKISHFNVLPWRQAGHEALTPRVIKDAVEHHPQRSRVHLLQTNTKGSHVSHISVPYLHRHHPEKSNHELEPAVPNDIKVCALWRVQVEQRGHVVWRLRCGYVPRDNMKPGGKKEKQILSSRLHI